MTLGFFRLRQPICVICAHNLLRFATGMVHGCGDLSGLTSDKLSSQSKIRQLACIRLFARGKI